MFLLRNMSVKADHDRQYYIMVVYKLFNGVSKYIGLQFTCFCIQNVLVRDIDEKLMADAGDVSADDNICTGL